MEVLELNLARIAVLVMLGLMLTIVTNNYKVSLIVKSIVDVVGFLSLILLFVLHGQDAYLPESVAVFLIIAISMVIMTVTHFVGLLNKNGR